MSGGWIKGPLPILVIAGAAFLAYRYVPLGDLIERFRSPATQGTAVSTPPDAMPAEPLGPVAGDAALVERGPSRPAAGSGDTAASEERPPAASRPVDPNAVDRAPKPVEAPVTAARVGGPNSADSGVDAPPVAADATPSTSSIARPGSDTQVAAIATPGGVGAALPAPRPAQAPGVTQAAPRVPKPVERRPAASAAVAPPTRRPALQQAVVPAPLAEPARPPALRILVAADTDDEAGLGAYEPAEYAAMLRQELIDIARGTLGPENVSASLGNMAFRDDLGEGRSGAERLCRRAGAERLLLADLTVPTAGFSTIPSAYWPEVVFTAINCADGRLHKSQKKRLEPHSGDSFDYQLGFAQRSQQFVASQAYFLRRAP